MAYTRRDVSRTRSCVYTDKADREIEATKGRVES